MLNEAPGTLLQFTTEPRLLSYTLPAKELRVFSDLKDPLVKLKSVNSSKATHWTWDNRLSKSLRLVRLAVRTLTFAAFFCCPLQVLLERFSSTAGYALNDYRRILALYILEWQLFMNVN